MYHDCLRACARIFHDGRYPITINTARLSSEAGATKIRGRQALHERAIALEKRIVEVEARMRGCEALVVRADPSAINLKYVSGQKVYNLATISGSIRVTYTRDSAREINLCVPSL